MAAGSAGRRAPKRLFLGFGVGLVLALAGCGGDGESGSEELARQHEIASARQQAAQDARQAERVKQLEREVSSLKRGARPDAATTTESVPEPGPEPTATSLGDWPGGTGYTAILASLSSESEARTEQAQATARGLDAGVLFSTEFRSLRPGYWVVFSGDFGTVAEAGERAERAQGLGYSDAYPRFVAP